MKFTVVGAGAVGKVICQTILAHFQNIELNIHNRPKDATGLVMDLEHAGALYNSTVSFRDMTEASEADFIFFTAGRRTKIGESRSESAKENQAIVRSIFEEFKPKPGAVIIVISNPVESMTYWISDFLDHKNLVIGTGTALDTVRLRSIIRLDRKVPLEKVKTMVIGEHGSTMTPIWSQTFIDEQNIHEICSESTLERYTRELKGSATAIRQTENATRWGVSMVSVELAKQFLNNETKIYPISLPAERINDISERGLAVSWPCKIGKRRIEPLADFKMTAKEKECLNLSIQSIKNTCLGMS
ncbi:MAG: hypothetical protein R3277_12515 [Brumimicrobium sp.]|nr:hypothetical protein [Brumimicrobium sp.]